MLQTCIYRVVYFLKNRDVNVSCKAALAELERIVKGYAEHYSVMYEIDRLKLYDSKHKSPDTPCGLQNIVQFDIRLYFCRRSVETCSQCQGHHSRSRKIQSQV